MFGLQKRLDNELKINSTTDLVILNSYCSILQEMDISDITKLARDGDKDAIRATLLVPALKLSAKFRDAQDLLRSEAERAILADDYDSLEDLRQQQADVDKVTIGLIETQGKYEKAAEQIKAKVVDSSEMPELG